ncbi:MAG: alpha/beta hydrolase [Lentisphaeria bacterium]|nr:alpha/beta hydrolase [Lentisphaeria bacterium]
MRQVDSTLEITLPGESEKLKIAYFDSKIGSQILLVVPGFASCSAAWEYFCNFIPPEYRIIRVEFDFKNEKFRLNQAEIFLQVIKGLELKKFSIVAHSNGCAESLKIAEQLPNNINIEHLIFINPLIGFSGDGDFCRTLANYNENNPLVRFASEDICAYIMLKELFSSEKSISADFTKIYADCLQQDGAKEFLIREAKKITNFNHKNLSKIIEKINIPCLIISGNNDKITSPDNGRKLQKQIENSELKIINSCGHLSILEAPEKTAKNIHKFVSKSIAVADNQCEKQKSEKHENDNFDNISKQQLHMRNLIENWSFGSMVILLFLKFIQLLKKCGLKASDNGWRKATGIFLQNEESKFTLGSFNLKYYLDPNNIPPTIDDAKTLFISRMRDYLQHKSNLHWAIEPTLFHLKRKKLNVTDIIETTFDENGELIKLTPHFDSARASFDSLSPTDMEMFFTHFIYYYNKLKRKKVNSIARKMTSHLKRWYLRRRALSFNAKLDLKELIERVLTATFITFEILPDRNNPKFMRKKFAAPNVKKYRHPGWGLLNMIVRFTPDLQSADLWVQYHHVPVDGMPMQELLEELKKRWGYTEELVYPNLTNHDSSPEIYYSGGKIFRARMFVDFSKLLNFRKFLNENYRQAMNGEASIASLIIWGLAQSESFRNAKVLFPIDIEQGVRFADERELSVLLIRPAKYFDTNDKFAGFLRYQREFNRRLTDTRLGNSESYEMLELYSRVHPIFYYLARDFFKESVSEYLGNMGLSMMKNAEMFISPISDLQKNGFLAFGNMNVPTADGKKAGAVSICGSRQEIKSYIAAISYLAENFEKFFDIDIQLNKSGEIKND